MGINECVYNIVGLVYLLESSLKKSNRLETKLIELN